MKTPMLNRVVLREISWLICRVGPSWATFGGWYLSRQQDFSIIVTSYSLIWPMTLNQMLLRYLVFCLF